MPTIGDASIGVHYDGKSLPEEARALGEEAGGAAGEEFADSMDEKVQDGFDETGKDLEKKASDSGDKSGKNFGVKFSDSVDKLSKKKLQTLSDDVAKIFGDDNTGLDGFASGLKNVDGDLDRVTTAGGKVNGMLDELHQKGVISTDTYDDLRGATTKWVDQSVDTIRSTQIQADEQDNLAKKLAASRGEWERINGALDGISDHVDTVSGSFLDAEGHVDDLNENLGNLRDDALGDEMQRNLDTVQGRFREVQAGIDEAGDASDRNIGKLRDIGGAITHEDGVSVEEMQTNLHALAGSVDEAGGASGRAGGPLGELTGHLHDLGGEDLSGTARGIGDVGDAAESSGGKSNRGVPGFTALKGILTRLRGTDSDPGLISKGLDALGDAATGAGEGAGKSSGPLSGLGSAMRSLPRFDPADDPLSLFVLLIALAPQVATLAAAAGAGLVILAGGMAAVAAFGVGAFVGFSDLFGDVSKLPAAVQPAAKSLQEFVGAQGLGLLKSALQGPLLAGLAGEFDGLRTNTIPALEPAFAALGGAINGVLTKWTTDLQSSGFQADFTALMKSLNPSITGLGTLFSNLTGIVGQVLTDVAPYTKHFIDEVGIAAGKFLAFIKTPEGKTQIKDFFDKMTGVLKTAGDAIVVIAGDLAKLVTPANINNTKKILDNLANGIGGLTTASDKLQPVIQAIGEIAGDLGDAAINFSNFFSTVSSNGDTFLIDFQLTLDGVIGAVQAMVAGVGKYFADLGKVISDFASGHWDKLAGDVKKANDDITKTTSTMATDIATAFGDASNHFDVLPKKQQEALTTMAGNFNVSKGDVKSFGGTIAAVSEASGVSIGTISKAKGWDDLASVSGLSQGKVDALRKQFEETSTKSKAALDDLATTATTHLATINGKLGVSGDAATALDKAITAAAGSSKTELKGLATTGSWQDILDQFSKGGKAAKTDLADKISAAMLEAGQDVDKLPPKIQALINKYGDIPAKKNTTITADETQSIKAIATVQAALAKLVDKRIDVTTYYSAVGTDATKGAAGAIGGIMAGGRMIAGGVAMAGGGILNSPQVFGNVLAGEAGSEAIVPLTGPLSRVDASVRALSAYARGKVLGGGGSTTVSNGRTVNIGQGAVQVITNNANAGQVASAVLDRLVPQL